MEDETAWVLNLLDGRQNLMTGIEHGAVTYALVARGRPIVGAVAPVFAERWYMAAVGLGSLSKHGRQLPERLEVSPEGTLAKSTLTFGLSATDNRRLSSDLPPGCAPKLAS